MKKNQQQNTRTETNSSIRIAKLRAEFENSNNPIISIDAKKKESIGNLYREGHQMPTETQLVFDHDFQNLAEQFVPPYAIYDLKTNESFVNIGTSCDTSDFVCDSIKIWWNTLGKKRYPDATSILILGVCRTNRYLC